MALTEINLTQEDGVLCQVFTRTHIVTADDPDHPEIEDEGPTPLEYLLTALASSAAISMRRVAEQRELEVEEIQISVKWRTSHQRLLDPAEPLPPTAIQRETRIRVARDITELDRDQLLAAAKGSPVDRALAGGARIEDALYILGYASPDEGMLIE